EWAMEDGRLYLLQARPITTLAATPDPDGTLRLWDNSNIAESYSGVTTPLTFSFARKAYRHVYRAFCRLLGVSENTIRDHADVFDAMIGLVRGRIYYNLAGWYRVLALLPGFHFNRAFMEGMMGVREGLPEELLPDVRSASRRERLGDGLRLGGSFFRLIHAHRRLPRQTRRFYARLDNALAPTTPGLERLRLDELVAEYRRLESALLTRWDAPIVNDFFAMIFFGLSKKLVERWGPADAAGLHNALLCGQGGIVSVEPARLMRGMAERVQSDEMLTETFCTGSLPQIEKALAGRPDLRRLCDAYLERFSDRCLDELKLESPTLRDDPSGLFRAVGALARRLHQEAVPEPGAVEKGLRAQAEKKLSEGLRGRPVRRVVLGWTLRHARARVAARENLRFERTRVFGAARRLFVEMGRRLEAEGFLDDPSDVFYLEVDELIGFAEGTTTTSDLRSLADVRRREFDGYHTTSAPADRFTTRGAVHVHNPFEATKPGEAEKASDVLRGLGCGPGVVQGRVRVVRDPHGVALDGDEILVAERTDPGWIGLFAACRGLVVERGSLLSHAAIVARELGLPAVIALPHATTRLHDGDLVEVDGNTGTVRVLTSEGEHSYSGETVRLTCPAHAG
ncbi:MAG: PEP-utilizing enzyme, partial [Rhodothermales bacterium]